MRRISLTLLLLGIATATHAQQQPGTPAATVIAVPPLTSPDSGTKGNQMLATGWDATQLIVSDLRQTPEVMPLTPKPGRLLFLSGSHRADFLQVALGGREGAADRVRPGAVRRAPDRWLLCLRPRQRPRACPQRLRRQSQRLAPRRA